VFDAYEAAGGKRCWHDLFQGDERRLVEDAALLDRLWTRQTSKAKAEDGAVKAEVDRR